MVGDDTAAAPADTVTKVVYTGDFSFAEKVMVLVDAEACTGATEDQVSARVAAADMRLDPVDDERDTSKTKPLSLMYALTCKHLCLMVAGETDEEAVPIPETSPYMAMKTFVMANEAIAYPLGVVNHALGPNQPRRHDRTATLSNPVRSIQSKNRDREPWWRG